MLNKKIVLNILGVTQTKDNTIVHDTSSTETNFGKLLEPGLRKIFFETYKEKPEQFSKIFHMNTSKKAMETDYGMGAFGDWTKRETSLDNVAYQKFSAGKERTYKHEAFTSGFQVERELVDDEQYRVLKKMPAALARSCRASIEKNAIKILSGAFTGTGYDGVPMCADNHPLLDSADTCSNLIVGELNRDNLKQALLLMRQQKDEAGNLIQMKADTLIIPPELEDTAIRLLHTAKLPGGNDNDTNEYIASHGLKIVVMDYLSGEVGGETMWFVQDSSQHEMNFFWRIKPEFKWAEEFDNFVAKYRGYCRYSFGYSDFRGIIGSTGVNAKTRTTTK